MTKQNLDNAIKMLIVVFCQLVLMWFATDNGIPGTYNETEVYYRLAAASFIVFFATIIGWIFIMFLGRGINKLRRFIFRRTCTIIRLEGTDKTRAILYPLLFFCLAGVFLELQGYADIFRNPGYFDFGIACINKYFFVFPIVCVAFPLWTQELFRGVCYKKHSLGVALEAFAQLVLFTAVIHMFFSGYGSMLSLLVAIVESIVVFNAVKKYVWKKRPDKRKFSLFMFAMYEGICALLLSFKYICEIDMIEYISRDWELYKKSAMGIIKEAALFSSAYGQSPDKGTLVFLADNKNYILRGLYDYGWVAVIAILALMAAFLWVARSFIGKNTQYSRNYLVYEAVWWFMTFNTLFAVLHSLCILPTMVSMPFAGFAGLYSYAAGLSLLLWSGTETMHLDKVSYRVLKISDKYPGFELSISENSKSGSGFSFATITSEGIVHDFFVTSYIGYKEIILSPIDKKENWIFILEKDDETGKYCDVKNYEKIDELLHIYITKAKLRYSGQI